MASSGRKATGRTARAFVKAPRRGARDGNTSHENLRRSKTRPRAHADENETRARRSFADSWRENPTPFSSRRPRRNLAAFASA